LTTMVGLGLLTLWLPTLMFDLVTPPLASFFGFRSLNLIFVFFFLFCLYCLFVIYPS